MSASSLASTNKFECTCGKIFDLTKLKRDRIECSCGFYHSFCIVFKKNKPYNTGKTCREEIINLTSPGSKIIVFPSIFMGGAYAFPPIFSNPEYSADTHKFFDTYKLNERSSVDCIYRSNIPETSWDLLIARIAIRLYTLKKCGNDNYANTTYEQFADDDPFFQKSLKAYHYYQEVEQNNSRVELNKFIRNIGANGIIHFKSACENAQKWGHAGNIVLPEKERR